MATHSSILAWRIPCVDRGAWQATVCGVAKSQTQLSTCVHTVHLAGQMLPGSSLISLFIPQTFTEQLPCAQGQGLAVSTICLVPVLQEGPVYREQILLFLSLSPCCLLSGPSKCACDLMSL